ncbi:molybdopterin-binding protein, partial [Acinetobacter baumannii]|uniref:molybdopterin-binding protein n=2 Tax=Moraxellaceae TaxID=468 RepID=UPI001D9A9451
VGVLATGDELVAVGDELTSLAQIYNSNTPTLKTLLTDLPITIRDYGIIPDDLDKTTSAVNQAMQDCDVLISTAGVSVGDYDFLTTVIEQLGQINHYKVAMKPGKPFVFGELTKNVDKPVLYFGLPGNPLSTVVGTLQFV